MAHSEALKLVENVMEGSFKIDPTNIDKFLTALRPLWNAVCREPECLFFEVLHDSKETGTFRFIEVWSKDSTWFFEHQAKKPYYKPFFEVAEPLMLDRVIKSWERVGGWSYVSDQYLEGSVREEDANLI